MFPSVWQLHLEKLKKPIPILWGSFIKIKYIHNFALIKHYYNNFHFTHNISANIYPIMYKNPSMFIWILKNLQKMKQIYVTICLFIRLLPFFFATFLPSNTIIYYNSKMRFYVFQPIIFTSQPKLSWSGNKVNFFFENIF